MTLPHAQSMPVYNEIQSVYPFIFNSVLGFSLLIGPIIPFLFKLLTESNGLEKDLKVN